MFTAGFVCIHMRASRVANQAVETNRRPAFTLEAEREFGRDSLIHSARIRQWSFAEDGEQTRARVFGIDVDCALTNRLERDGSQRR